MLPSFWMHRHKKLGLKKHRRSKPYIINYSDNTAILWVFSLILILNQFYHQTHIADELTYIITRCSWSYLLLYYSYGRGNTHCLTFFSQLHDKHFETDEKISCRIDGSIIYTPFSDTIYRPLCWFDKSDESIFFFRLFFREKCIWSPCFFVQYRVIQLKYSWQNYILNNFSLLDSLLRLAFLLMTHGYFIMIM